MTSNNITASPSPKTQARLFEIANQIALKNAQEYQSSTWHSWNVVFDAETKHHFGIRGMDSSFWTFTGGFGSCLGASTRIYTQLQGELSSNPDLEICQYSNTVQLMTTTQRATKEIEYHAVVAMCFNDFAIVIDHALHPAAFRVPLGGAFEMTVCPSLYAVPRRERFEYFLEDGQHKLTVYDETDLYDPFYFSKIDINKATNQIAIAAAREKQPIEGQEHILMPPHKYLSVRSLLKNKPQYITAERVDNKWLATTVHVQVQFARPAILMSVPHFDWLQRYKNNGWYKRLKDYRSGNGGPSGPLRADFTYKVAVLKLSLNADTQDEPYGEMDGLAVMHALGEEFGLNPVVLSNMVWSVYRVWAPYRCKRADSIMHGEKYDAGEIADA